MLYTHHDSPIGQLLLVADASGLRGLFMAEHKHGPTQTADWRADEAPFAPTRRQLDEYFAGTRRAFDVALAQIGTPFQLTVWRELMHISFGETRSYGDIAQRLGKPNASRAVGAANGRNPLSIIVPCHRVVGSNGTLTGYGGGEPRKRWLLEHEARFMPLLRTA